MGNKAILIAEAVAQACDYQTGTLNRQCIEDFFEEQTEPVIFKAALRRADQWPWCRDPEKKQYGLQYALLLEFLICDEKMKRKMEGLT